MHSCHGQECSAESQEPDPVAALTEELQKTAQVLRDGAGFSPQATIRFDSSGLSTVIASVAAFSCLTMLMVLILVVVWLNGQTNQTHQELSDLKNNDHIQDAYLRQHGDRIGRLESPKKESP